MADAVEIEGCTNFLGGDFIAGRGVGGIGMGMGMPERGDLTIGKVVDREGEEIIGLESDGIGPAMEE